MLYHANIKEDVDDLLWIPAFFEKFNAMMNANSIAMPTNKKHIEEYEHDPQKVINAMNNLSEKQLSWKPCQSSATTCSAWKYIYYDGK